MRTAANEDHGALKRNPRTAVTGHTNAHFVSYIGNIKLISAMTRARCGHAACQDGYITCFEGSRKHRIQEEVYPLLSKA